MFKAASVEERRENKFFAELEIEKEVDEERVKYVREELGISEERFL